MPDESTLSPTGSWPPAFSENFLSQARERLAQHNVVVIVGEVGNNRTELAEILAPEAAGTMWADEVLSFAPYSSVQGLFPDLPIESEASTSQVVQQLRDSLSGQPTLVVPDADVRDAESLRVLTTAADDGLLKLIVTASRHAVKTVPLGVDPIEIPLDPLDSKTVGRLLQARFGARPHPTVISMIQARSVGAYHTLRDMAEFAAANDELAISSGVMTLGPGCSHLNTPGRNDYVEHLPSPRQLAEDHPARRVLETVAFIPRLAWVDAEAMFTETELKAAQQTHLVHRDGADLLISSPAEGIVLRHHMTKQQRTDLLDDVSPHLSQTLKHARSALSVAEWTVSCGRTIDPDLAVRSVGQANLENRYEVALAIASALDPASAAPSRLIVECIYANQCLGDLDETRRILHDTDPADIDDDDLIEFLYWSVQLLPKADSDRKIDGALQRADVPNAESSIATLELAQCFATMFEDSSDELIARIRALAESGQLSQVNLALAQVLMAVVHRHRGRAVEAVACADRGREVLNEVPHGSYHLDFVLEILTISLITNVEFDRAEQVLTDYVSQGAAYGNFGRLGTAVWSMLEFERGDHSASLACVESFIARTDHSDPLSLLGWAEGLAAEVLMQFDRRDEALEMLRRAASRQTGNLRATHDLESKISQAGAFDLLAEPDLALELLDEVNNFAQARGLTFYAVEAAGLIVQIDGPYRLSMLQAATAGRTDLSGSSLWWKRFGDAMAANNMRALVELAQEMAERDAVMVAAEVAQFTLDVARRAADMTREERDQLTQLATPMEHRHVER